MKKLDLLQMEDLQGGELTCRKAGYLTNVGLALMMTGIGTSVGGVLAGGMFGWYLEHCM